jgi:hypothetical protein
MNTKADILELRSTVIATVDIESLEARYMANQYSISDRDSFLIAECAINPELLAVLAEDDNDEMRATVASHAFTDVQTLTRLASDEEELVRNHVAKNPNTPGSLLRSMAVDGVTWDAAIAQNSNADMELLDSLVGKYADSDAASVVAQHPNTAISTLYRCLDGYSNTRLAVIKHPKVTACMLRRVLRRDSYNIDVQRVVATSPVADAEALDLLARVACTVEILEPVAAHPNTSVETLNRLLLSEYKTVAAAAIAARPERITAIAA